MNLMTAWVQLYKLLSSSSSKEFNVVFSSTRVQWIRAWKVRQFSYVGPVIIPLSVSLIKSRFTEAASPVTMRTIKPNERPSPGRVMLISV